MRSSDGPTGRAWAVVWLAPLAVGIALRLYRLCSQILTGDELHSVNAALAWPLDRILRSAVYFGADYCVPLTATYRLLLDRGVVLSELGFRVPVLVAGIALLVVIPRLLAPRIGRAAAGVLAVLLAISPLLVFYGRIIRSYTPVLLLAFCAVAAFERWWRTRARRDGVAYVALGSLAIWFHLGTGPFVGAPFVHALLQIARRRERWRADLARLGALMAALAGAVALLLLPASASLFDLVGLHGEGHLPDAAGWLDILRLHVGTASWPVFVLALLAAARGTWVLWRRDADLLGFGLTLAAGQVVGLWILSPNFLQAPVVASRYLLMLLPLLLVLEAVGLASPWFPPRLRAGRGLQTAAVAVFLGLLFASGPLAWPAFRTSSFVHTQSFLNFLHGPDAMPESEVPRFYRELRDGTRWEPGAIFEYPWLNVATHAFHSYQNLHGRELRVASLNRLHGDPRVALRNMPGAQPADFLASPARYLVVHLDLRAEEGRVRTPDLQQADRLERLPALWNVLRGAAARMAPRLEREWGSPVYADDEILVWDLETIRRRALGPAAETGRDTSSSYSR